MRFRTSAQPIELDAIPASSTTAGRPCPRTSTCNWRPPTSTIRPGGETFAIKPIFTGASGARYFPALLSRYHGCVLNDYLLSILLGIVEGLTEFLPVSSTAHLRITEALVSVDLGDGYWKMFSIVIQLGAILCLPIYFRHRIMSFLATWPRGLRGDKTAITHPLGLTLVAFVCTAVPSFLLTKVIGKHLENLVLMASALIVGGIVMWIVDAIFGQNKGGGFEAAAADE